MSLTPQSRELLIRLARQAILAGCEGPPGEAPEWVGSAAEELRANRASFVTLSTARDGLRGCRGALRASRPLYADVWRNAWASAFDDPRFPPVTSAEVEALRVEISVLGPLEPLRVETEAQLLAALGRGRDGLLLAHGQSQATFLPKVWEVLPEPREFVRQLRLKAGLRADFWSPELRLWRYQAESFGD